MTGQKNGSTNEVTANNQLTDLCENLNNTLFLFDGVHSSSINNLIKQTLSATYMVQVQVQIIQILQIIQKCSETIFPLLKTLAKQCRED